MCAPQPEVFTMTCSTPAASKVSMVRRARASAVSCSPAWAWSAPQQACVRGAITSTPFRARTRAVAWFWGPKATCWMQPVSRPTRARRTPVAGVTSASGARSAPDGRSGSRGSQWRSGSGRNRSSPEARTRRRRPLA